MLRICQHHIAYAMRPETGGPTQKGARRAERSEPVRRGKAAQKTIKIMFCKPLICTFTRSLLVNELSRYLDKIKLNNLFT